MEAIGRQSDAIRIGHLRVRRGMRVAELGGERMPLGELGFATLVALAEHVDEIRTAEQLAAGNPGANSASVAAVIPRLRLAFGERGRAAIETFRGRGYRLNGEALRPETAAPIELGALVLQPATASAYLDGRELDITLDGFRALLLLARRPDRVVPSAELIAGLIRGIVVPKSRLKEAIKSIRSAFGECSRTIVESVADGYRLNTATLYSEDATRVEIGDLRIDRRPDGVYLGGMPRHLTKRALQSLCTLAATPDVPVSVEALSDALGAPANMVRDAITQLREGLGKRSRVLIRSAYRRGYLLDTTTLHPASSHVLRVEGLEVRRRVGEATLHRRRLFLTPPAFNVLAQLAEHPDEIIPLATLLEALGWPTKARPDLSRTVGTLKAALGRPNAIETVRGQGYRLTSRVLPPPS